MGGKARSILLAIALALAAKGVVAAPPTNEAATEIKKLTLRAIKAQKHKRWAEVASLYLEAHQIAEDNNVMNKEELLYHAAVAFDELQQCERASELYTEYGRRAEDRVVATFKARFEKALLCAPSVRIDSRPSGAEIELDDEPRGLTPKTFFLKPGKHRVRLSLLDHDPDDHTFEVKSAMELVRELKSNAAGKLKIDVSIDAMIFIDDVECCRGPYSGIRELAPGNHLVRIERSGCKDESIDVSVPAAGEEVSLSGDVPCQLIETPAPVETKAPVPQVELEREDEGISAWVIVGLSLGGAAAANGIVFLALSGSAEGRYEDELAKPDDQINSMVAREARSDADSYSLVSTVSFIVAAAGLAGAGVFLIIDTATADDEESPRYRDGDLSVSHNAPILTSGVRVGPGSIALELNW